KFKRWARLRLPNGQIARCAWKEKLKRAENVRMSRNVKDDNDEEFEYIDDEIYRFVTVTMVSVYSRPDPELLQKSAQTVWSCTYHGNEALQLVSVKTIHSVVAMVPHRPKLPSGLVEDRFFLVEKPGLGLVSVDEEMGDDADEDE
ncbi:hypothetical protein DEU56DRAFT_731694, partial [Suillus clintonianus]|uniref:uncharacterized protein n=1 Tax=Suillus clintonianus TaxID=1904413 RepID=UPI001B874FF0